MSAWVSGVYYSGTTDYEILSKEYFGETHDSNNHVHHSSSHIKKMATQSWFSGSAATQIGQKIHGMLEDMLAGKSHDVVLQEGAKNTAKYLAQKQALDERGLPYTLCTKTDYGKLVARKKQTQGLVRSLSAIDVAVEPIVLVDQEVVEKTQDKSPLLQWARAVAMKARPDLLIKQVDGSFVLADWKTTSERSLSGILKQLSQMDYVFSLCWYRDALRCLGVDVQSKVKFYFLPDDQDMGYIPITVNLDDPEIYAHLVAKVTSTPMEVLDAQYRYMNAGGTWELEHNGKYSEVNLVENDTDSDGAIEFEL